MSMTLAAEADSARRSHGPDDRGRDPLADHEQRMAEFTRAPAGRGLEQTRLLTGRIVRVL